MWDRKATQEVSNYQNKLKTCRDNGMSEDEINSVSSELMSKMSPDAVRLIVYLNKIGLGERIKRSEDGFDKKSSEKIVLAEIEDVMPYLRSMEWAICTFKYLSDRMDEIENKSHKKIIKKFLGKVLGGTEHYGNIYEQCYKGKKLHPGEIPEIDVELAEQFTPSIQNWKNLMMAREGYIEEARLLSSMLTGVQYTQENRIFVHGIFDSQEEVEQYKSNKKENIKSLCYEIPVGKELLLDPFRDVLSTQQLYTEDDEALDEFLNKRELAEQHKFDTMKKRMEEGTPISEEDAFEIDKYKREIGSLQLESGRGSTTGKRKDEINFRIEQLQKMTDDKLSSITNDNQMVLETFKSEKGRLTKKYLVVEDD